MKPPFLPFRNPRYRWAKLPISLIEHPEAPRHDTLTLTLALLADHNQSTAATRAEIIAARGISMRQYLAGMKWLRSIGAVEEIREDNSKSNRRIILRWMTTPNWQPANPNTQKIAGAQTEGGDE